MKKVLLRICLIAALIVPVAFLLPACGEKQKNFYYTIETPENCTFYVNSSAADRDGRTYVNKGREFDGYVQITPGYEVCGELVLKVNGEVVPWSETGEYDQYAFTFTPTGDFDIVIEGTILESLYEVRFVKSEDADVSGLYIRFDGETEQTLDDFLKAADAVQNFRYNDTVSFYVYTKGYGAEPSVSGNAGVVFYKDEEKKEYGYSCNQPVTEDLTIEFYGTIPVNIYFVKDASGNNLIYGALDTALLTMSVTEDELSIAFGDAVPQDTISRLTLTINGEEQKELSLSAGGNTIPLKRAYEYVSEDGMEYSPYHYTIDLNFYDFPDFDGVSGELTA